MSEKSIAQRLFLKKNFRFLLLGEPPEYLEELGNLPEGVILLNEIELPVDLIQVFVMDYTELVTTLEKIKPAITSTSVVWISYPKGTSRFKTDINRDIIAAYAKTFSLKAVAIISIDSVWSALRVKRI